MAEYRLSRQAEGDLEEIGAFTTHTWGEPQADRYLAELEDCFILLASRPGIGRKCDWIIPGLRRLETGRHVVYFSQEANGILVYRILHQSMLPSTRQFDGEA